MEHSSKSTNREYGKMVSTLGIFYGAFFIFEAVYSSKDGTTPPLLLPETWHITPFNNHNVTLIYVHDDVALYNDNIMEYYTNSFYDNYHTWPLPELSTAWKYVKHTYGPIGSDLLFFILHENNSFNSSDKRCSSQSFVNSNGSNRNLIDCHFPTLTFKRGFPAETVQNFETIFSSIGDIIQYGAKGKYNDADRDICGSAISDILFYDIYRNLRSKSYPADVANWEERLRKHDAPRTNRQICFDLWFIPMYETYNETSVLNRYFELTKQYWRTGRDGRYEAMNLGDFTHFWSGAAGKDLQHMAAKVFRWTEGQQDAFLKAQATYQFEPLYDYTDETTPPLLLAETWHITPFNNHNVTRVNFYDGVALYTDNLIDDSTDGYFTYHYSGLLSELSTAWKYVKHTYGPIRHNLILILHGTNSLNSSDKECTNQSIHTRMESHRHHFNLIDCHFPIFQFKMGFLEETVQNFETIFSQISNIILYRAKGKYNDADQKICGSAISDILFYDIYRHLRSKSYPTDLDNWKERLRKHDAPRTNRQICFYLWFIPIYETYNETSVLNRYFELTMKYWRTGRDGRYEAMNLGDFTHFWSGAAGKDLQHKAAKVFKWTEGQQNALRKARDTYHFEPPYDYTVSDDTLYVMERISNNSSTWTPEYTAAVVCACIVIVVIIIVLGFYNFRNKSQLAELENRYRELTAQDVDAFQRGSMYMNLEDAGSDLSILCMPFNMAFEVPAEQIAIDKNHVLGQGEFGIVYLGTLKGKSGTLDMKVAVKKTKLGTQVSHFKAFLSEIKIMAFLEKHENIAALLATVTHNISKCEVIAVLEFCEKGDLLNNLQRCRRSFRSLWSSQYSRWATSDYIEINTTTQHARLVIESENIQEISTLDLISWATQIANGMLYLSSKNIIHGDLAARNVLLTADNISKISDFGLSRQLAKYSNYQKTSSTPIPWKWLAIEALTQQTFSIQSDVWSFGVTLWEIFTLGQEPYPGRIWDKNFVDDLVLIDGDGLIGQTEFGNSDIHDLRMNCMQEVPTERFSFARIKTELETIKSSLEIRD